MNDKGSIDCVRDIHIQSLTFPTPIGKECCRSIWIIPKKGLPTVLKGVEENIKRGERILHALRICWRDIPKMLRNNASIHMFIEIYNACGDSMKGVVVNAPVLFFTTLDRTDAGNVAGEKDNDEKIDC